MGAFHACLHNARMHEDKLFPAYYANGSFFINQRILAYTCLMVVPYVVAVQQLVEFSIGPLKQKATNIMIFLGWLRPSYSSTIEILACLYHWLGSLVVILTFLLF